jgi:hypothetical protein
MALDVLEPVAGEIHCQARAQRFGHELFSKLQAFLLSSLLPQTVADNKKALLNRQSRIFPC